MSLTKWSLNTGFTSKYFKFSIVHTGFGTIWAILTIHFATPGPYNCQMQNLKLYTRSLTQNWNKLRDFFVHSVYRQREKNNDHEDKTTYIHYINCFLQPTDYKIFHTWSIKTFKNILIYALIILIKGTKKHGLKIYGWDVTHMTWILWQSCAVN